MVSRLSLFGQSYNLNKLDSETLKVSLLDALSKAEHDASLVDEDHRDFEAMHQKITRLKSLIDKFGI